MRIMARIAVLVSDSAHGGSAHSGICDKTVCDIIVCEETDSNKTICTVLDEWLRVWLLSLAGVARRMARNDTQV